MNGQRTFLPDDGVRSNVRISENKACRVQSICIEERKRELHLVLQICINFLVVDLGNREIHMKTGTCSLAVFRLHMVAARNNGAGDIREKTVTVRGTDPRCRIIAVIVVAVHHNAVGTQKVLAGALVVLERAADMVAADGGEKCLLVSDGGNVRIGLVGRLSVYFCE